MQASPNRSFCINSGHLLYVLALAASAVSLFQWWGIGVAGLVVLVWWQVLAGAARELDDAPDSQRGRTDWLKPHADTFSIGHASAGLPSSEGTRITRKSMDRSALSRVELIVVLMLVALLVGLMIPSRPEADPMSQAAASLRLVAQALEDYRDDCGSYPSAIVRDRQDGCEHSWRALLLPYMGERPLADAYRLDEPWDGIHNRRLATRQPWPFRDFSRLDSDGRPLRRAASRGTISPSPTAAASGSVPSTRSGATTCSGATTTMQLLEFQGHAILVEHEAWDSMWLEPNEPLDATSLVVFASLPACDEGFWQKGFFSSTFRGRLIATEGCQIVVHPSGADRLEQTLMEQCRTRRDVESQTERPPSQSLVLGEATTVIHYQRALQFIVFVGIVLMPLFTLDRLRGHA